MAKSKPWQVIAAFITCAGCSLHAVAGAELSLKYGLEVGYSYTDNVRIQPEEDDKVELHGYTALVPLLFGARTERSFTQIQLDVKTSEYNESGYNSDDQLLRLDTNYEFETGQVEFNLGADHNSTTNTELLDTGVIGFESVRRENLFTGLSVTKTVSQKSSVELAIDYSDVSYDDGIYHDYRLAEGTLGWVRAISARTNLLLRGYASQFDIDANTVLGIETNANASGALVGFQWQASEVSRIEATIGGVSVDVDYSPEISGRVDDTYSGVLFTGKYSRRTTNGSLNVGLRIAPMPSSNGEVVTSKLFSLKSNSALTNRTRFLLEIVVGDRDPFEDYSRSGRTFFRVAPSFRITHTQSFYSEIKYEYSHQDRETLEEDANANGLYLSFLYQPKVKKW